MFTLTHTIEPDDPRITAAISGLKQLIRERYPKASFTVYRGEDPCGIYLRSTVDVDDLDDVMDVVIDRLYDVQVEQGLPVYVVMTQPARRIAADLRKRAKQRTRPLPDYVPR